jgi:hypothetical protein
VSTWYRKSLSSEFAGQRCIRYHPKTLKERLWLRWCRYVGHRMAPHPTMMKHDCCRRCKMVTGPLVDLLEEKAQDAMRQVSKRIIEEHYG